MTDPTQTIREPLVLAWDPSLMSLPQTPPTDDAEAAADIDRLVKRRAAARAAQREAHTP